VVQLIGEGWGPSTCRVGWRWEVGGGERIEMDFGMADDAE